MPDGREPNIQAEEPVTVRSWLVWSAVTTFAHIFGMLAPRTFFARGEDVGPASYWVTMPIRVLVYPVSFIVLPFLAVVLTLVAWLLVLLCAPLIWRRARKTARSAAAGQGR